MCAFKGSLSSLFSLSLLPLLALLRPNPIPVPPRGLIPQLNFNRSRTRLDERRARRLIAYIEMTSSTSSVAAVGVVDLRPPFTAAQWQELEHQALIYKYLVAGLPVPPDLLLPIRRSLESLSARFFHHSSLGYCSYYGKKIDPEPGRCRRTDGKKWRCSKDAYPDSKYCERHMHRGRNRSRKLVESQSSSQSSSSSTTVISSFSGSNGGGSGSFQSLPFHSIAANQEGSSLFRNHLLKLQVDPSPYDDDSTHSTDKEFRYFQGVKSSEAYEQNLSPDGGSARAANVVDDTWRLMPSQNVNHSNLRYGGSSLQNETRELYMRSDYEPISLQQQQHILFRSDITSSLGKEEEEHHHYAMRDFLDEGATTAGNKGLWYNNNKSSFSNTRLSISGPETSSEISTRNSSPNDG
ncbi:growth-regulating factor 4-like [Impatiens glandulifera]|uniref:growth-regulating factor 4-like n=1 Tax=Impatiens glandulifera TaxID=253017 RepID=UPI001FB05113|nr:growth-regulating factor 4-like [Impatiens glandulifera]